MDDDMNIDVEIDDEDDESEYYDVVQDDDSSMSEFLRTKNIPMTIYWIPLNG